MNGPFTVAERLAIWRGNGPAVPFRTPVPPIGHQRITAGRAVRNRHRRWGSLVVLAVIVLGLVVGTASGQQSNTIGEPDIDIYLPENGVTAGSETTLEFQIQNDGDLSTGTDTETVLTARGASLSITDDGPFTVRSGETSVGSIPDGETATATQRLAVPDDLDAGEYDISVRVRYSYTEQISQNADLEQRQTGTEQKTVTVRVDSSGTLEIVNVTSDLQPGTDGQTTLDIENTGSEDVTDIQATISGSGGLSFDGESASVALGDLETGESTTVTLNSALSEGASSAEKPVEAVFEYRDSTGVRQESAPTQARLAPGDSQSFTIENLTDTLSVGYDGTVTGTVVNDGPRTLTDGVLVATPKSDSMTIEEQHFALPELEPGDRVEFEYPTDVSGTADAGPRQIEFALQYANEGQSTTEVAPRSHRVVVQERQSAFSIDGEDSQIAAGQSTELVLNITNERPETLTNIDANLYTNSPYDSTSDDAFVSELEPGERAELVFELSAENNAQAKTYPVELDFEYDTERGSTVLSDTYQHPVEVTSSDQGGVLPSITLTAVGLLTMMAVGVGFWYRRWRRLVVSTDE